MILCDHKETLECIKKKTCKAAQQPRDMARATKTKLPERSGEARRQKRQKESVPSESAELSPEPSYSPASSARSPTVVAAVSDSAVIAVFVMSAWGTSIVLPCLSVKTFAAPGVGDPVYTYVPPGVRAKT